MKKLYAWLLLIALFSCSALAQERPVTDATLLNAVTATGAGSWVQPRAVLRTFQVIGSTSSGSGSAVVSVQGSNDGANAVTLCTITLTLSTTVATDACVTNAPYKSVRGNVTTLSGTGAAASLFLGY